MATQEKIHLVLTTENLEFLRQKVASHHYETASDLVNESLDAAREHDAAFQRWLEEVAGPIYDRMSVENDTCTPIEDLSRHIASFAQYEKEVVGPACDRHLADPSSAISMAQLEREFAIPHESEG